MPDTKIFSPEATAAELKKLDDLPENEAHAGVVARDGDIGAEIAGHVDIGHRGGFVEGEASWMRRAGWGVAAMIGWKGKQK